MTIAQNVMIREENLPLKGRIREETASMSEIRRFIYVTIPVLEENVETRVVFVVKETESNRIGTSRNHDSSNFYK